MYVYTLYHIEHKASLEIRNPPTNEEVTNPAYYTIADDDHCKEPVEKPIGYYAEVIIPTQVKMTPNPAYVVP